MTVQPPYIERSLEPLLKRAAAEYKKQTKQ